MATVASTNGGRRWFFGFVASFLVSLVLGLVLPKGLNALARPLNEARIPDAPVVHFFAFALVFVTTAGFDTMLWFRQRVVEDRELLLETLIDGLEVSSARAVDQAIRQGLLPGVRQTPRQGVQVNRLLGSVGSLVSSVPADLLPGIALVIEDGLARVADDVAVVAAGGLSVTINQHIAIARALAEGATSFVQVNRRAFVVPEQWTSEWLSFVDDLGQRAIRREYIVLMPAEQLRQSRAEISSMAEYLRERAWRLKLCELEPLADSLGGTIPTTANLDIYDDRIVKLQTPPSGEYRGGIRLRMEIVELATRPELLRFANAVKQFSSVV
jgi:hypothetical protein